MDVIFISTGVFYKQVFFQLTVKINFCNCVCVLQKFVKVKLKVANYVENWNIKMIKM